MTELDYNFVISRNLSLSKITNTNILVVDSSAYANYFTLVNNFNFTHSLSHSSPALYFFYLYSL